MGEKDKNMGENFVKVIGETNMDEKDGWKKHGWKTWVKKTWVKNMSEKRWVKKMGENFVKSMDEKRWVEKKHGWKNIGEKNMGNKRNIFKKQLCERYVWKKMDEKETWVKTV